MSMQRDAALAARLDDFIGEHVQRVSRGAEHPTADVLLDAIRAGITYIQAHDEVNRLNAGLLIDVIHARTEDWLTAETE